MRIFAFILFFFLLSCDNHSSDILIVGTSADNPPYEYIKDGKIVGIDIEIIEDIAKILNKKIEIKNIDFSMLIPALSTCNVDIVIAGISPTEERSRNIDFSDIYFTSNIAILFKKQRNISSSSDLKDLTLGAQFGTTWSKIANSLSKKVRELSNNLVLIEELNTDRVDAIIIEESQAKVFANKYPNFKYLSIEETSNFAIALLKNSSMTKPVNDAIKQLKKDKTIERIQNEWFKKN